MTAPFMARPSRPPPYTSAAPVLVSALTGEGLSALKSAIANKTTGKITLKKKDGTTVTADCKDGNCTFEDGTTVTEQDAATYDPDFPPVDDGIN